MFTRIISLLILVPAAIVLIVLSVANRQSVTMAFNPFDTSDPVLSLTAPFFVFLFLALILGMVIGSVATWLKQGKYRARARTHEREAVKWHGEADRLKANPPQPAPATPSLPTTTGSKA